MSDVLTQIKIAEAAKERALSGLHTELGYPTAEALANAILSAVGASTRSPIAASVASVKPRRPAKGRRVPDSVRAAITAALKAGETASLLPRKFGVSYNIVHLLKKDLGMVKARSKT